MDMAGLRRVAYLISALAVACFFLFPEPGTAIIGALLLQTLAFIVIAGRSAADGIVLTGITILLIGMIPADHPLVREPYFLTVKPWFVAIGIALIVSGLLLIGRKFHSRT
jgi:hypothetical protein